MEGEPRPRVYRNEVGNLKGRLSDGPQVQLETVSQPGVVDPERQKADDLVRDGKIDTPEPGKEEIVCEANEAGVNKKLLAELKRVFRQFGDVYILKRQGDRQGMDTLKIGNAIDLDGMNLAIGKSRAGEMKEFLKNVPASVGEVGDSLTVGTTGLKYDNLKENDLGFTARYTFENGETAKIHFLYLDEKPANLDEEEGEEITEAV